MAVEQSIVIGYLDSDASAIADALGACFIHTPKAHNDAGWEVWRDALGGAPRAAHVVVALQAALPVEQGAEAMDPDIWAARAEMPLMHWIYALGGAALACADGGAIVAVVDAPPPLDSAGLSPEAAVADGVAALARSLALSEGARGVRANSIFTPHRLVTRPPIKPDPPLPGFPGTLEGDVMATVRLLLSADAAYLSGHNFPADRGRSW